MIFLMQNSDIVIFFLGCFRRDFEKGDFWKMVYGQQEGHSLYIASLCFIFIYFLEVVNICSYANLPLLVYSEYFLPFTDKALLQLCQDLTKGPYDRNFKIKILITYVRPKFLRVIPENLKRLSSQIAKI